MKKETKEALYNAETLIVEAARAMDREEREILYDALHDWAYRRYEETLVEGYAEAGIQDCGNE